MRLSVAFDILLDMKAKGAIKDFSLAQSTLEQVFIYFARFQKINQIKPWFLKPKTHINQLIILLILINQPSNSRTPSAA